MENISNGAFIVLYIIGFLLIVITVTAIIFLPVTKEIKRREAKANNNTVNFLGQSMGHTRVKCPIETCLSQSNGYCTDREIDLCMLVQNNYDEYGMYCKKYIYDSVVDAKV